MSYIGYILEEYVYEKRNREGRDRKLKALSKELSGDGLFDLQKDYQARDNRQEQGSENRNDTNFQNAMLRIYGYNKHARKDYADPEGWGTHNDLRRFKAIQRKDQGITDSQQRRRFRKMNKRQRELDARTVDQMPIQVWKTPERPSLMGKITSLFRS